MFWDGVKKPIDVNDYIYRAFSSFATDAIVEEIYGYLWVNLMTTSTIRI